ncbi:MAG: hypothetical protein KAS96_09475 [Planctomycetes bacterium]|nr:hypothetical protein [Planctomycetota bacterium]
MGTGQNKMVRDAEKVKDIPKWTKRYAENRTLTFVVSMVVFLVLFAGIGLPSYFGGKAYRDGNMVLFWVCMLFAGCACLGTVILSVPRWGDKITKLITRRLYRKEGEVVFAVAEKTKKQQRVGMVVAVMFVGCLLLSVVSGFVFNWPIKYMQPISAIYVVPFIIFIGIWQRPVVNPAGFLSWLWPVLYGVHAILIVAGVPIVFDGPWTGLNMLIPVAGYGLLCGLAGHFYSRYALRKLKNAAKINEVDSIDGV